MESSANNNGKFAVAGATGRLGRHVVDVLVESGHEVVPISRSKGVDVITGEGLKEALEGVTSVIDVSTPATPDGAAEFFEVSARNLMEAGEEAGVKRITLVSIVGADRFSAGYNAAKIVQEKALQSGPIPVRVLRATQFHEFVEELVGWGTQGDVSYVPPMRTQLIAARSVAEAVVDLATDPDAAEGPFVEVAGPREESLPEMGNLLMDRRGESVRVEAANDPDDPDAGLYEAGAALPGPDAKLAGPTYEEWLESAA